MEKLSTILTKGFMVFLIGIAGTIPLFSQTASVNATGLPPNASAGLDVDFTNLGFLIPRLALSGTTSFSPLTAHIAGMIVYNTATSGDVAPAFYINDGIKWIPGTVPGTAAGEMQYWNGTAWASVSSDGAGNGNFTSSITGLTSGTLYYVRAYATNNSVTSYGNQITFATLAVIPTIMTTAVTNITINSATSGGNLTNLGGAPNTERGICYVLSPAIPTTSNTKITDLSTGIGGFVSNLTGLNNNTAYNIRAYAVNSAGTGYGATVSLTTRPVVSVTTAATAITSSSANTGGTVDAGGGAAISARGVCYATTATPTTANSVVSGGTGTGAFTCALTGLVGSMTYYVRAYATNAGGTVYGPEISFSTTAPVVPILTTTAISAITITIATSGGNITDNGGAPVTARGICWSTTPSPTTANSVYPSGTGNGAFFGYLTGLTASTYYYVRAYATNTAGTAYGNEINFLTCNTPYYAIGTSAEGGVIFYVDCTGRSGLVAATADQGVTNSAYGCSGTLVGASGTGIYAGITNTNAILANCATAGIAARIARNYTGGGFNDWYLPSTGEMIEMNNQRSVISGINLSGYYWSSTEVGATSAYTAYGLGTQYTSVKTYVTGWVMPVRPIRKWNAPAAVVPTLTTAAITNIGTTTATSGGVITANGGATVTSRGVCWSTISGPTIANSKTTDGAGNGTFISNITGLTPSATYYVRAYATNSAGTAYGDEQVVTVNGPPVVTTAPVAFIQSTSATCGGNVTSDGGLAVTAYGVCWDISPNPTVALTTKTVDGSGLGTFTSSIIDLTSSTQYYVRAYATNSGGTSYGTEISFTPGVVTLPTVTTDAILNLVGAIAEGGGTVLSDGGDPAIVFGLCWNTSTGPTITTNLGMTTDFYSNSQTYFSTMTGLSIGTVYYIRAYATNSVGTSYGSEISFTGTAAYIGQVITGGYLWGNVFSIDGTGLHGLIADPWGFGASDWGCNSTTTGAAGTAVGTGSANTNDIIADIDLNSCTSGAPGGFAAPLCRSYGADWYLPSKDEFDLLWTNRVEAGIDVNLEAAAAVPFRCSSEVSATTVWYFDATALPTPGAWFDTGLKTAQYNVWGVRSF